MQRGIDNTSVPGETPDLIPRAKRMQEFTARGREAIQTARREFQKRGFGDNVKLAVQGRDPISEPSYVEIKWNDPLFGDRKLRVSLVELDAKNASQAGEIFSRELDRIETKLNFYSGLAEKYQAKTKAPKPARSEADAWLERYLNDQDY
jgi:hypothetical protein